MAQVVERPLWEREAPGSSPGAPILLWHTLPYHVRACSTNSTRLPKRRRKLFPAELKPSHHKLYERLFLLKNWYLRLIFIQLRMVVYYWKRKYAFNRIGVNFINWVNFPANLKLVFRHNKTRLAKWKQMNLFYHNLPKPTAIALDFTEMPNCCC